MGSRMRIVVACGLVVLSFAFAVPARAGASAVSIVVEERAPNGMRTYSSIIIEDPNPIGIAMYASFIIEDPDPMSIQRRFSSSGADSVLGPKATDRTHHTAVKDRTATQLGGPGNSSDR